jgi:Domain of unknown function (DUF2017)
LSYESRIERAGNGDILLRLPEHERELLRGIALSIRERLAAGDDDPALRRLFPPAYAEPEREAEYRELTRAQLLTGRERALDLLAATVDRDSLAPEEADSWLRALNDMRLVLGTALDVKEDLDWGAIETDSPHAPEFAMYGYLSWIQEQLVDATA